LEAVNIQRLSTQRSVTTGAIGPYTANCNAIPVEYGTPSRNELIQLVCECECVCADTKIQQ